MGMGGWVGAAAAAAGDARPFLQDLRARNDALSEAKLQAEIQKEVERGMPPASIVKGSELGERDCIVSSLCLITVGSTYVLSHN